jgi:uncharacterized iron-regulated membrane protein
MSKIAWRRIFRTWHRRLGLIIGIQLLFWTIGGVYFAWFHIDNVHGDYERDFSEPPGLKDLQGMPPIQTFIGKSRLDKIKEARVGRFLDRIVVRLVKDKDHVEIYDAFSGELLSPISKEQARRLAINDFTPDAAIRSVIRVAEKKGEYKGPVPAYRVSFEHSKGTNVYVHINSGVVTARRNKVWRGFDFLWMLHIMDYKTRDDMNNWILKVLSLLGLITILSGYSLWLVTRGSKK